MTAVSRRDFARLLTLSGSAAFWPTSLPSLRGDLLRELGLTDAPLPRTPANPDEQFWKEVRARFLMPPDLAFINAANICPTPPPVVEALEKNPRYLDANPPPASR